MCCYLNTRANALPIHVLWVVVCAFAPAVRESLQIVGKTDLGEGKEGLLIARILVDGSFG